MADYNSLKKCMFCGESIPSGAARCAYCGSILEVTATQFDQPDETQTETIHHDQDIVETQYENDTQADVNSGNTGTPQGQVSEKDTQWNGNPIPQENGSYIQPQPYRPIQGNSGPNYQNRYQNQQDGDGASLSNGMKVFLTILFTVIPGIGQVAGIITAIVFMSSTQKDRKSFGVAILVASLIMFVLSCIGCFVFSIAVSQSFPSMY